MIFSMLFDPRFLQMKSLPKLHEAEGTSSYLYFPHTMEHLFVYVVAAKEKKNPLIAAPSTQSTVDYALPDLLSNNTHMESTRARATREFETYKQLVTMHFILSPWRQHRRSLNGLIKPVLKLN